MNVFIVKFHVSRTEDGHYRASCTELGAFAEAPTLPALEEKLSVLATVLLSDATEDEMEPAEILVSKTFPAPTVRLKSS